MADGAGSHLIEREQKNDHNYDQKEEVFQNGSKQRSLPLICQIQTLQNYTQVSQLVNLSTHVIEN